MKKVILSAAALALLFACNDAQMELSDAQNSTLKSAKTNQGQAGSVTFAQTGSVAIGGEGAAEISAFDPKTKKLFVVNNSEDNNRIEVVDFSNPAAPVVLEFIDTETYGGLVNSVSVSGGKLAAAVEADEKTDNGKVLVFDTDNYSLIANVEVGALPDMVTFSPDGNLILTANEGEPNDDYSVDPVGSVSIISVNEGYSAITLDFSGFGSRADELKAKGFRIFGLNASFAQDIEPEYVAVAENSKKAWVTLQENNGIAVIDLNSKTITDILPLGFKDYSLAENAMDLSDKDKVEEFKTWPVKSVYMPDAIAVLANNNVPFVFTANEGDAREYDAFSEIERLIDAADLDETVFPNADELKAEANLGRLNITTTMGDNDGDGDIDEIYSFGARSFSIWNGNTGRQIFDSGNELDKTAVAEGNYDDKRSDDKGSEPEGVVIGRIGNKSLLFVGLERVDGVAVYDVTNPVKPMYLQWLDCGDAPEGLLFIPATESPNGNSILVVSSEGDGVVTVFETTPVL